MRIPRYHECSKAEVRRALRWALRKLHLQSWDVRLLFETAVLTEPALDAVNDGAACMVFRFSDLTATVGVRRDVCEAEDDSPIFAVFHEAGHLVAAFRLMVDPELRLDEHWERQTNTIALLLYELWEHEHLTPNI